jgi:hypothetical protein
MTQDVPRRDGVVWLSKLLVSKLRDRQCKIIGFVSLVYIMKTDCFLADRPIIAMIIQ